jgi:3-methyladenine DNA glycosylase AlkD
MLNDLQILKNLKKDLIQFQNKEKAVLLARFFKTGKGQYGEGDIFLGITVPNSRIVAKKYKDFSLASIDKLIKSKIHEERLVAVLILVEQYKIGDEKQKEIIYKFYLAHAKNINNWDLVDLSAPRIVGDYLLAREKTILLKLAKSKNLWERRMAIISTFQFIYFGKKEWTFKIAKILLNDKHDLIHKACGWMLREAGKRISEQELEIFLKKNVKNMPRTMLRYAIERLPEKKRKYYLNLK